MTINKNYFSNPRLWYIIYTLAILSWLSVIATTSVTNIGPDDFLGIVGKLPIYFYIAIFLTIISVRYAYVHNNSIMLMFGSFILIMILFLTYPLIEPNASYSVTYYPSGMAKQILEKGYMSEEFNYKGYIYLYYPSFQIFTSVLMSTTDLDLDFIIKYFHFLFIFAIIIFISLAYKLLSKSWKFALVGSLFFSAFLWSEQLYYGPQLFAFMFMIILYTILIKYIEKRYNLLVIMVVLAFIAINSSHLLSSLMIISFLYMMANIKKVVDLRFRYFFMTFLTIFLAWLIYIAVPFFRYSVKETLRTLSTVDTYVKSVTLQRSIGDTINETIVFDVRIIFIILNIVLSIIAIYMYLKDKNKDRNKDNNFNIPIFWIIGIIPLVIIAYGGEIILRMYLFSLIGTIFFITYLFVRINCSVATFAILLILSILNPVAFAGDKGFKFVSDSEMSGDTFFTEAAPENIKAFYIGGGSILKYIDPSSRRDVSGVWLPPRDKNVNLSAKKYNYILQTEMGTNGLHYYLGNDPVSSQIDEMSQNRELYKIYDNKNFSMYKKLIRR